MYRCRCSLHGQFLLRLTWTWGGPRSLVPAVFLVFLDIRPVLALCCKADLFISTMGRSPRRNNRTSLGGCRNDRDRGGRRDRDRRSDGEIGTVGLALQDASFDLLKDVVKDSGRGAMWLVWSLIRSGSNSTLGTAFGQSSVAAQVATTPTTFAQTWLQNAATPLPPGS